MPTPKIPTQFSCPNNPDSNNPNVNPDSNNPDINPDSNNPNSNNPDSNYPDFNPDSHNPDYNPAVIGIVSVDIKVGIAVNDINGVEIKVGIAVIDIVFNVFVRIIIFWSRDCSSWNKWPPSFLFVITFWKLRNFRDQFREKIYVIFCDNVNNTI
jgi:hypothetical protein